MKRFRTNTRTIHRKYAYAKHAIITESLNVFCIDLQEIHATPTHASANQMTTIHKTMELATKTRRGIILYVTVLEDGATSTVKQVRIAELK